MTEKNLLVKPYPLGAHCEAGGIRFSFVSGKKDCGVIIYDRATGRILEKLPFTKEERLGKIYCKHIKGLDAASISYHFYEEDRIIADERARAFADSPVYGRERLEDDMKAIFTEDDFDWEEDCNPMHPYENCVAYCMHVRGFTKHSSSGVTHKGTFLGMTEKLPYLKETGITTVELQPAYEFLEIPVENKKQGKNLTMASAMESFSSDKVSAENLKLNYWGYQKGFYYTPKACYAAGKDAVTEFKTMVREFHKNGMEIVMQFYFTKDVPLAEIPEILRFWVMEYHVDGFRLMGENVPMDMLLQDAVLANTKLWYYQFNTDAVYEKNEYPDYCNLATYQDDYLYAMRKFLKGDDNMLGSVLYHMRHIPEKSGRLHYLSNYYGMTLRDMVSYNYKHNEENGEGNRDGNDYNCSWNCGEEGITRKKRVNSLRLSQLKNAMCMLVFSQSTPLIFMGDEFGNSQQGNNNPYCQDNRTTWLDWKDLERNRELYSFWKQLITLRREHPILRPCKELKIMDYIGCGYPDLSYHGQSAWRPELENNYRHVGVMYCGKYAKKDRGIEDDFFYVAMNMHWEPQKLALPKLPKGLGWQAILSSVEEQQEEDKLISDMPTKEEKSICKVPARSILVFKSEAVRK